MLTAHAFEEHRRRAADVGADAFLSKPVLPDDLAVEIRKCSPSRSACHGRSRAEAAEQPKKAADSTDDTDKTKPPTGGEDD